VLVWTERRPDESWPDAEPDAVVWIDPALFDAAWKRSDQWVGPGGRNGAHDLRYPRVGQWIEAGNSIEMCVASRDGEAVCFTDGRHRFAWLRDRGLQALPMQVTPDDALWFARQLGTPLRTSVLPSDRT
jgi:hypothetical protein